MKQSFSQLKPQITELKQQIQGSILFSSDSQVRKYWNMAVRTATCLIVRVKNVQDIIKVLNFARRHRLPLAVRSGWHNSYVGYYTENQSVLIDLSDVNHIDVNVQLRNAHLGPGNTWGDVSDALQPYKLAIPSGDAASVGVGGLTQGSGIGFLSRKYGLTIDALRSIEMVTADGEVCRASRKENPELFWGVRGGAGNFGIITDFEFDLFEVEEVLGGTLYYKGIKAEDLLKIVNLAYEAPDELTVIIDMMAAHPVPFLPAKYHFQPVISVSFCYAGDLETGKNVIAPFRKIGNIISDQVTQQPYKNLLTNLPEDLTFGSYGRNMYMETFDEQKAKTFVEVVNKNLSSNISIQLRVLGGAISRVPENHTAFAHRNKPYLVHISNVFTSMEEADRYYTCMENVWDKLKPYAAGADVNFIEIGDTDRLEEFYSEEILHRLISLKKHYDLENIFRNNLNLKPDITNYPWKD